MFKISSTRVIEVVKLLEKSKEAIDHLEISGGKNKIIYKDLKKKLEKATTMWKKGLDLENFDEWNETS